MLQFNQRNALLAVIFACLLWIGYVSSRDPRTSPTALPAQKASLEEIQLAPDYTLLAPGRDLHETITRPLFNASRRPSPASVQPGSDRSSALPSGRYTLTGVSISEGKREALLHDATSNATVRVEQSKEVNGVLVESVTPTKVTLKLGAEREEIPLKIAPAPRMAAAANLERASGPAPSPAAPMAIAPPTGTPPAGAPQAAADVANADPITDADVAEREARIQARRNRQSSSQGNAPR